MTFLAGLTTKLLMDLHQVVLFAAFAQDEELAVDALVERDGLPGVADALVVEVEAAPLDGAARVAFGGGEARVYQQVHHGQPVPFQRGFGQFAAGHVGKDVADVGGFQAI